MKRFCLAALSCLLALISAIGFVSCGKSDNSSSGSSSSQSTSSSSSSDSSSSSGSSSSSSSTLPPPPPDDLSMLKVYTLELTDTRIELEEHEYYDLTVIINDGDNDVSELGSNNAIVWETSNAAVATVDSNGRVIALAEGYSLITASAGKKTTSCYVFVSNNGVLPTIEMKNVVETRGIGLLVDSYTFTVEAMAYFMGKEVLETVQLTWTAQEDGIIQITPAENSLSATIKGVGAGRTRIQVCGVVFGTLLVKEFDVWVITEADLSL